MKHLSKITFLGISTIILFFGCTTKSIQNTKIYRNIDFNLDWEFYKLTKEEAEVVKDTPPTHAHWKKMSIPHDWSIESGFIAPDENEKIKKDLTVAELGGHLGKRSTGFMEGGIGWYKKKFTIPEEWQGKNIYIDFDGVYMYSDVWINGQYLGHHHYGYTAFGYDLTPFLRPKGENELLVRAKNKLESRWYSGSGIYRPVTLNVTNRQHIKKWGTYITTPEISATSATVAIETRVTNTDSKKTSIQLRSSVLDKSGKNITTVTDEEELGANSEGILKQTGKIPSPELWDTQTPNLYTLKSEVIVNGTVVDVYLTNFGVRDIQFDAEKGFLLNGEHTILKGVCIHHDNGILGAKSYAWAEERKVLKLKEMGTNAIRFSHNPPSKEMLDMCDKHGMLVIDESFDEWKIGKANGYKDQFDSLWQKDMTSMLLRDRNHPSIIMWSIGNEVPEQGQPEGAITAKMLSDFTKKMDPTRPTTVAAQPGGKPWGGKFPDPEFFDAVDISGYNYENWTTDGKGEFVSNHKKFPSRIMYQSESTGQYLFDTWMKIYDNPYILGDFIWTGIDYLGETGCGNELDDQTTYPAYIASCGSFEHTLFTKPRYYYTQVLWSSEPVVHVNVQKNAPYFMSAWGWQPAIATWNWNRKRGDICKVDVYSNCDEVELIHNGKSLGRKPTTRSEKFTATWEVPYVEGELRAVGYTNGNQATTDLLKTAEKPTQIKLLVDRDSITASGSDICFVTAEIVDNNNIRNTLAKDEIAFSIEGPGEIIAVGNGSHYAPLDHPFIGKTGLAHEGRLLVVVRSTTQSGEIKLTAAGKGLRKGEVTVQVVDEKISFL